MHACMVLTTYIDAKKKEVCITSDRWTDGMYGMVGTGSLSL